MPSTHSSPSRRRLLTGLLVGALALGVAAYVAGTRESGTSEPRISDGIRDGDELGIPGIAEPGDVAPDLRAPTLDGGTVDLAALRGRPVIVNFWASYCFPCREEFPLLREVFDEGDVDVIGVVFRNDIRADAERFAAEMEADWPQALDADGDLARAFGVRSIPRTFFIDSDGTIRSSVYGFTEQSFRRQVAALE